MHSHAEFAARPHATSAHGVVRSYDVAMSTPRRLLLVSALAAAATLLALTSGPPTPPPAAAAEDATATAEKLLAVESDWAERVKGLTILDELKGNAKAEKLAARALKDDDWGVAIRACKTLSKIGTTDSAEALADAAVFGDIEWLRVAAADALGAIDPTRGTDALLDRAAKYPRDDTLRRRAIDAAARIAPKETAKRLEPYVKMKEPPVAAAAVRALGRIAERNADVRSDVLATVDDALAKRGDKKAFFSYAAACTTLAAIDAPEARSLVLGEIREKPDDDDYVQERIARGLGAQDANAVATAWRIALGLAKKPDEIRRMVRLAERIRLPVGDELIGLLTHKDDRVRSESARALGQIGDRAAAPSITALLDDKSFHARLEAVSALARLLEFDAFLALGEKLAGDSDEQIRLQFVVETADLRRPEGIAALKPFLADSSWRVQSAAAATVGTLGIADDLPLLQPLAGHKDWKIRAAAFEGMGRLRAKEAVPLFMDALNDRDPVVRGTCLTNLQILTGQKFGYDAGPWRAWWEQKGASINFVKKSRLVPVEKVSDANKNYAPLTPELAIEVLQKARMLVVEGAWDKVQIVLGHLKIPHSLMRAQELKYKGLNPNQILLVNCEGNMDKDSQERLRWFVNVGGYVMTTDWALTKTVQPCFPGYVKQFSGANTGNDVVVVEEAHPNHPFTQGCFENVPALQWWLEIQAFPITVTWPERCEVIVDSAEMKQKYGSSPMAVTFRWGLGKVQHSLSHFYLQEEGMQKASAPRDRMIFAADNLGLSLEQIRTLKRDGAFDGGINSETMKKIAPDYSMFRLIVNVVREKSEWVENL